MDDPLFSECQYASAHSVYTLIHSLACGIAKEIVLNSLFKLLSTDPEYKEQAPDSFQVLFQRQMAAIDECAGLCGKFARELEESESRHIFLDSKTKKVTQKTLLTVWHEMIREIRESLNLRDLTRESKDVPAAPHPRETVVMDNLRGEMFKLLAEFLTRMVEGHKLTPLRIEDVTNAVSKTVKSDEVVSALGQALRLAKVRSAIAGKAESKEVLEALRMAAQSEGTSSDLARVVGARNTQKSLMDALQLDEVVWPVTDAEKSAETISTLNKTVKSLAGYLPEFFSNFYKALQTGPMTSVTTFLESVKTIDTVSIPFLQLAIKHVHTCQPRHAMVAFDEFCEANSLRPDFGLHALVAASQPFSACFRVCRVPTYRFKIYEEWSEKISRRALSAACEIACL
jgi:hypothetical protein